MTGRTSDIADAERERRIAKFPLSYSRDVFDLLTAPALEGERQFEAALRPGRLAEFTGQARLKENLSIAIEAAKQRGDALDHRQP